MLNKQHKISSSNMDIAGLDYNTQRKKLTLPEYGREIHEMVAYCVNLPTKEERQKCAEAIISIMAKMNTQGFECKDYLQKLWDHLALMADFKLDIDYPYDISHAKSINSKPAPLTYPMSKIPIRHYGKMMFKLFDKLKTMEEGEEKRELVRLVANQMKRCLIQWGHGSSDDEKVASDLSRFTDGAVQLDLTTFKFDPINPKDFAPIKNNKRKR